jgi:hypothetical protein
MLATSMKCGFYIASISASNNRHSAECTSNKHTSDKNISASSSCVRTYLIQNIKPNVMLYINLREVVSNCLMHVSFIAINFYARLLYMFSLFGAIATKSYKNCGYLFHYARVSLRTQQLELRGRDAHEACARDIHLHF